MPADSRTLDEEGVVIPPTLLDDDVLAGARRAHAQPRRAARRPARAARRAPPRRAARRRALRAPRARRRRRRDGRALRVLGARRCAPASPRSPTAATRREDVLEPIDGELELHAAVTIDGDAVDDRLRRDRRRSTTATSTARSRSRARPASTSSACLVDPDLPASGGAFAPVTVSAPEGCLVNARPPAAVAAGNVETSSPDRRRRLRARSAQAVDVPAQGQGTMNNVTLGNERFTYYETIGGGQGACPDADGPIGVHVAMSNTLSTPVEALELQYPLRVERYALRLGSGGDGRAPRRRRRRPRAARARGRAGCRSSPSAARARRRASAAAPTARRAGTASTASRCRRR